MNILLSVFACAPTGGSEGGVGWRWATELAKEHRVLALTDITRRPAIEAALSEHPVPNLRFVFFRPWGLRWVVLNRWTANVLYSLWQHALFPTARRLHREEGFDLAIHLTYGVFRTPSFLGFLGIPFVFGPVGGGEDAPWRLKRSFPWPEKAKELLRHLMNLLARWNPMLRWALGQSTLILVKTVDTRNALPVFLHSRCIVYPEIGIDRLPTEAESPTPSRSIHAPINLFLVGRLTGLKGIHLALRAVARARRSGCEATLTIAGTGPLQQRLQSLSRELGIAEYVQWMGTVPQTELLSSYSHFDAFLFPSLHDSSGNAVLEAQAGGLPVICLDLGGPPTLVDASSALVVPTLHADEEELVHRLAEAIKTLAHDEPRRQSMSAAAQARARTWSWSARVKGAMACLAAQTSL